MNEIKNKDTIIRHARLLDTLMSVSNYEELDKEDLAQWVKVRIALAKLIKMLED